MIWVQLAGIVGYVCVLGYAMLLPLEDVRHRYKTAVVAWTAAMLMLLVSAVTRMWLVGVMWIVALWLAGRVAEVALSREMKQERERN